MNLSGDREDEAELVVGGLEFELSFFCRHVDAREDGRLRFGGESFADDLQRGNEIRFSECDVHMRSFPEFSGGRLPFSMGTVLYINIVVVVVGAVDLWKSGKTPEKSKSWLWIN